MVKAISVYQGTNKFFTPNEPDEWAALAHNTNNNLLESGEWLLVQNAMELEIRVRDMDKFYLVRIDDSVPVDSNNRVIYSGYSPWFAFHTKEAATLN